MALTISRADVPSDRILEGLPNRFIKLPISNYLNVIDIDPLPSQIGIINAVNKYRFIVAAISRRQGKTYISNIIGQTVALIPGSHILIMSPNYSLSQISFDLQRELIRKTGIEVKTDNKKDKVIELTNGSTIRMGSVNQVDSCVGRSYDLIIFDEAALADGEEAFEVSLRPTLDREGARAMFISTPRGKTNWFARFYDRGFDSNYPEWCSIKATWEDNPRMSKEDIEEARKTMTEAHFRQEYEADFNTYEGQIWPIERKHIIGLPECEKTIDDIPPRDKLDVIGGLDIGFKDATAVCIFGYDYENDIYYSLDEYKDSEQVTSEYARNIGKLVNRWDPDFMFIDSSAAQTKADLAYEYDISTVNAKKSKLDGIGHVGALVANNKLFIQQEHQHIFQAFDGYKWDPNKSLIKEKPIHDEASHMADAIRYALYSHVASAGIG